MSAEVGKSNVSVHFHILFIKLRFKAL
uniref:Uncharacterized protein n=1 Tax=Anguilla anguilla TaxID=7936 RepID=A0A0E9T804_ANGAN